MQTGQKAVFLFMDTMCFSISEDAHVALKLPEVLQFFVSFTFFRKGSKKNYCNICNTRENGFELKNIISFLWIISIETEAKTLFRYVRA